MKAITSNIVALLALFLLGNNALCLPLVCAQGHVYAMEFDLDASFPDSEPSSDAPSSASEIEEREEELFLFSILLPSNAAHRDLRYASMAEQTLVGVSDEPIIPPNA